MIYHNSKRRAKIRYYSVSILYILATSILAASGTVTADVETVTTTNTENVSNNELVPIEPNRGWGGGVSIIVVEQPPVGERRTIHYVYEDGTAAAPDVTELIQFGWRNASWVALVGDATFDTVVSPVIEGYTADQIDVPEVTNVLPSLTKEEVDTLAGMFFASNPFPDLSVYDPDYGEAMRQYEAKIEEELITTREVTVTYKKNVEGLIPETPAGSEETPENSSPLGDLESLTQIPVTPSVTSEGTASASVSTPAVGDKSAKASVLPSTGEKTQDASLLAVRFSVLSAGAVALAARLKQRKS